MKTLGKKYQENLFSFEEAGIIANFQNWHANCFSNMAGGDSVGNLLTDRLSENPIIAAIKSVDKLDDALKSSVEIIFLLTGDVFNLKEMVDKIHKRRKKAFVHVDLIEGISSDPVGLRFICETVQPDGIITTKGHLIKAAKKMKVLTIQRLFILDSLSLDTGIHSIKTHNPDAVEILPGVMPKITRHIVNGTQIPIITGGLIKDKDDVIQSLKAGAMGISTSSEDIWEL